MLVDIASTIINYRIYNNLSQQELADKLECKISKIKDFESGDYNFTDKGEKPTPKGVG